MVKEKTKSTMGKTFCMAVLTLAAMGIIGCADANSIDWSEVAATVKIESIDSPALTSSYSYSGVNLSWNPVLNADEYWIYRSKKGTDGAYGTDSKIATVSASSGNSYTDTSVSTSSRATYRYRVQARTTKENLADSEKTIEVVIEPESASWLGFSAYHDGDGKVYLSWEKLDGYSYTLKRTMMAGYSTIENVETQINAASANTKKINDVAVIEDDIEKTFGEYSGYMYTLTGTKSGEKNDVAYAAVQVKNTITITTLMIESMKIR